MIGWRNLDGVNMRTTQDDAKNGDPRGGEAGPLHQRLWIDVEDLFDYAAKCRRPSGIQRLEYELCCALATLPEADGRVLFVRHDV